MFSRSAIRVSRRYISTFPALRTEGAAASTGTFGIKEKAVENQWARVHVSMNYIHVGSLCSQL
jgi:hypothetical protein